jgi:hypothetical protein
MNETLSERRFPPWVLQDWVLGYPGMPTNLAESVSLPPLALRESPPPRVRGQTLITELRDVREAPLRTPEETKRLCREVRAELKDELEKKRKKARRKLFEELRAARGRLKQVRGVEVAVTAQRRQLEAELIAARVYLGKLQSMGVEGTPVFPPPPLPTFEPSRDAKALPDMSGVYFLWEGEMVAYVGKAKRLCDRLRLGTHHVMRATDRISFLPFPAHNLSWAESFYIGVFRPTRNFGQSGFHRKYGETGPA